ncbi:MAG: hypothetical protein IH846_18845 [Acidobacteria bacterium]|nr:hypothetical protein [Acidobacteriota bacterium]
MFDVRNNFSFSGTYELPFGRGLSGAAEKLFAGWQIGGILSLSDGFPGTVEMQVRRSQNRRGVRFEVPDLFAGADNNPVEGTTAGCDFDPRGGRGTVDAGLTLGRPNLGSNLYFDPCAFTLPPDDTFGNLGRNTIEMPGLANLDLSVTKNTQLSENANLQFRFEAFNLFNRPNFGIPALEVVNRSGRLRSDAGEITDTKADPRKIQLGLKLIF